MAIGLMLSLTGCMAAPALIQALPTAGQAAANVMQDDQTACRQAATQSVSGPGTGSPIGGFANTTFLGALLGPAAGALKGGAVTSAGNAQDQPGTTPQYDTAYANCMAAKGKAVSGAPSAMRRPAS